MDQIRDLHTENRTEKENVVEFSLLREEDSASLPHPAALLVHGLTASPLEMKELAKCLFEQGYDVFVPCLGGHGTSLEDLKKVSSKQWLSDVEQAFKKINKRDYQAVFLVGQSFGAILCLYLAAKFQNKIAAVALLAPPLLLRPWHKGFALWLLSYCPDFVLSRLGTSTKGFFDPDSLALSHYSYSRHSIGAGARLFQIARRVKKMLKLITAPMLIVQDPEDYHVPPNVPPLIARTAINSRVEQVWANDGHHVLTKGAKHREIYSHIVNYFETIRE